MREFFDPPSDIGIGLIGHVLHQLHILRFDGCESCVAGSDHVIVTDIDKSGKKIEVKDKSCIGDPSVQWGFPAGGEDLVSVHEFIDNFL